ncbi:DNA translocase FtsK [Solibacillus sp. FSL K6-1523]|uniref:DNA translocase FtsK n=1 Tax=Solibacillus sp. FSL K6-1523 TaxID=2921471 RepID=UPI0030F9EA1C
MSWIKNQINKFLYKDTEDEFEDAEYEHFPENKNAQYEGPKVVHDTPQTSRTAFRFPLINDEDVVVTEQPKQSQYEQPKYEQHNNIYNNEDTGEFKLPQYLQKPAPNTVYDVEVSGIRDLLERRRKGRGHSNVIRSQDSIERRAQVTKPEREILLKNPKREEQKINKEFVNPLATRKRFVPTDVPSPVHGFQKPTPIETLLEERQQPNSSELLHNESGSAINEKVENTVAPRPANEEVIVHKENTEAPKVVPIQVEQLTELQTIIEEVAATTVEPTIEKEPIVLEEEVTDIPAEIVSEPVLLENQSTLPTQEEVVEEESLNEVQVKHVTIENSTIHIGQLNVEQPSQTEDVQVANEEHQIPPQLRENTGSRVPFNVVMLKSDKQKLMARQLYGQQNLQGQVTESTKVLEISDEKSNENVQVKAETPLYVEREETSEPIIEQMDEQIEIVAAPLQEAIVLSPESELPLENSEQFEHSNVQMEELVTVETVQIEDASEFIPEQIELAMPEEVVEEQIEEPIKEQSETLVEEITEELVEDQTHEQVSLPVQEIEDVQELSEPIQQAVEVKKSPYVKPPLDFLVPPEEMVEDREWMDDQGERLVEALSYFQIQANIESIVQGPAVTQFEITVGQGTKVSKVRNLADDIKLALAAKDIRIDAPIPGKRSIGIEIPNRISRAVRLSEVTDSDSFCNSDSPLEAALGLDLTGKPVTIDLRKMPHGLIAGATGSGKSVCINSILVSLLYKSNPNDLKLMLIDPKMVELAPFNHIPHLVSPVITDVKAATAALKWAVEEMERRYQLFMHSGARKIEAYNKMCEENGMYAQKLPYLLIVIDELADLMMMSPQDVEDSIVRITQKARAAGIHLIVATQRPSVDVITGLIKSNIPTRIAFSVSSQIDSRTILDAQGAERLLGRGDMLYLGNGMSAPTRIQGTFVTDDEIEEIIEYVRDQGEPEYIFKQEELLKRSEAVEEQDELFEEICRFVFEQGSVSTSLLQRRYKIGYNRAARLIDMLESQGFVSEPKGSKPRDVFITEEDLAVQFGD